MIGEKNLTSARFLSEQLVSRPRDYSSASTAAEIRG